MNKKELLRLAGLLALFLAEYGTEIGESSTYTEAEKVSCAEVLDYIAEKTKEKINE